MENTNSTFTPEQAAAIAHRGSSLLVSSAAGSGKTMVLVERLLGYIEQKHSIDEFLVITYTRAAAHELRERIYEGLQKKLQENPGNLHLRRQAMLSAGAYIDTIHTFCSIVLRENAHIVGLPPDFRVADQNESELIRIEVAEEVFRRTYDRINEQNEPKELLSSVVDGRSDKKLVDIVLDIHGKLRSIPDPERWIENQRRKNRYDAITDISQTDYGKYLLGSIHSRVEHCHSKMVALRGEMRSCPDFEVRYKQSVEETITAIGNMIEALSIGWNCAREHREIPFDGAKPITGYDELKAIRTWCRDELRKISKALEISSEDHIKDLRTFANASAALLEIVGELDKTYTEEKRKRGVVDFSDLEHMTLSLLYEDKKAWKKTAIASGLSKRFTEILIDEYQDINEVQEKIF